MNRKITIGIDGSGIDQAIRDVAAYKSWLEDRSKELCRRLAELGATKASLDFSRAIYNGKKNVTISVDGDGLKYTVRADGESVLFIEFGSGIELGKGHPANAEYGMGPGTWSDGPEGKGHWNDPNGWYLPKDKGGGHSYGNPPAMAMYNATKYLEQNIKEIAREVFGTDTY